MAALQPDEEPVRLPFGPPSQASTTEGPGPASLREVYEQRRDEIVKRLKQNASSPALRIVAAIHSGSIARVQLLLRHKLASIDERDYNQSTPLHVAAGVGDGEMVCLLIAMGGDVAAVDGEGRTPRDVALKRGHAYAARVLEAATQRAMQDRAMVAAQPSHMFTSEPSPVSRNGNHTRTFSTGSGHAESPAMGPRLVTYEMGIQGGDTATPLGNSTQAYPAGQQAQSPQLGGESSPDARPGGPNYQASKFSTISDTVPVIICMVGLPGRGKSFISNHIRRYLNWKGVPCRVFNAGNYRRKEYGAKETGNADFFDDTPEHVKKREEMAQLACSDAIRFVNTTPGATVAVLDATNTTVQRRSWLCEHFAKETPQTRILFIESVCNVKGIIHENILRAKFGGDDFSGVTDANEVLDEFQKRIKNYESRYAQINAEENLNSIRIIDVKQTVELRNIQGVIAGRIASFLLNLHPVAYPIYVCRHAETGGDVLQIFGGDETLTERGKRFAEALKNFALQRAEGSSSGVLTLLYAGNSNATQSTVNPLIEEVAKRSDVQINVEVEPRLLGSINYGSFMLGNRATMQRQHPRTFQRLFGESTPVGEPRDAGPRLDPPDKAKQIISETVETIEYCDTDSALMEESPTSATGIDVVSMFHTPNPTPVLRPAAAEQPLLALPGPLAATLATSPAIKVCTKYPAYTAQYQRGESTRSVAVRLEDIIMRITRAAGPLLIVCPDTPARVLLAYLADLAPEQVQHVRLPLHAIVEVGPKGDVTVNDMA